MNCMRDPVKKWFTCETCERVVGLYGDDGQNDELMILVDFRIASMEHRMNLPDASGKHSFLMVNKLIELESGSGESIGDGILDWTSQSREGVAGETALDLTVSNGVIDLTVSSKKKNILKRVFDRIATNAAVQRVIRRKKGVNMTRVKLIFDQLPPRNIFNPAEYSDLATLLPGEEIPEFDY